jgi:hypothetical protein
MNDSHVVLQKRDIIHGTMSEEISSQKRKCSKGNQDEITDRGFGSKSCRADVAKDKVGGDSEKDEGHPVGECSGKGGPRPLKTRLFPEGNVASEPDRDYEQTEMKNVAKPCIERLLGYSFMKGEQKAAKDGKRMCLVFLGVISCLHNPEYEEDGSCDNCSKENNERNPQQRTFNKRIKIHGESPPENRLFREIARGGESNRWTFPRQQFTILKPSVDAIIPEHPSLSRQKSALACADPSVTYC